MGELHCGSIPSGRSGRRGARTFDAATNALVTDHGDDRSVRSAQTSVAERSAAAGKDAGAGEGQASCAEARRGPTNEEPPSNEDAEAMVLRMKS